MFVTAALLNYVIYDLDAINAFGQAGALFQLVHLKIDQQFNRAENPTDAEIIVEQAQLDDSVAAIRTEYQLKRDQETWKVVNKKQSYQCARGGNTKTFQFELCP